MTARLPFVDAHVHLWDLDHLRYPWLRGPFRDDVPGGSPESIATTYRLDDYRAEAKAWNLVGMVHVDAGAHPDDALGETAWLQGIADTQGMPDGIVAQADLAAHDLEALLERHRAHRNVRGIRQIVCWHADPARSYHARDFTGDAAWRRGYAALARHGLSFDLQCYPSQMPSLAAFVARHPGVPVVIDHLGMPVPSDHDGWAQWRAGMRALAAIDHVVGVKLSGGGFIARDVSEAGLRARIRETIEIFGTRRALLAGNFPTDRMFASFDTTLGVYERVLADLSESERRDIWARNAIRAYRLAIDADGTRVSPMAASTSAA